MAKDLNKVMLTGRLGKDPEVRITPNGVTVATFSVASGRNVRQPDDTWKEETEWFRCVAWREIAERVTNKLQKGSRVFIEGRLQTREWQDNNGQKQRTTEVIINDLIMLDARKAESSGDNWDSFGGDAAPPSSSNRSRPGRNLEEDGMDPEDIPF